MPTLLLDTTVLSLLMKKHPEVLRRLGDLSPDTRIITSVISRGEILFGLQELPPGKRKDALQHVAEEIFGVVPQADLPSEAASTYATLKSKLRRSGRSLDENDLWIGSHAIAAGATLITGDKDFDRIEDLGVEHWL